MGGLATHQGATNKLFYETDLEVPVEGAWQVAVLIDGPVGAGEAAFEIEVRPAGEQLAYPGRRGRGPGGGGAAHPVLAEASPAGAHRQAPRSRLSRHEQPRSGT